jgi:hypothetical protein
MQPCPHILEPLNWYLADELSVERRADIEHHLANCPGCREEAERLRAIIGLATSGNPRTEPEESAVREQRAVLMASLAARAGRTRAQHRTYSRPLFLRPVYLAAAALLLIGIGFVLGRFVARQRTVDPNLQALLTGFRPAAEGSHSINSESLDVQRVRYDPKTGQVEIEYNTMNDVRYRGDGSQPHVQQMLARAMTDGDNVGLRLRAVKAAGAIAEKEQELDPGLLQAIDYLLKKEQNQGVRLTAVRVLRALPLTESIKAVLLKIMLYDENTALRIEAFDGLAAKSDGKIIEPYLQAMEQDSSSYLRFKAKALLETNAAEPVRSAELAKEN